MVHIDIVGLGPGDPGQITLKTLELLENQSFNYFRTEIHPTLEFINTRKIPYCSFDHFYESEENFKAVYQKIVATLIKASLKKGEILYAVPGNPLFGEETVVLLIEEAKKRGISYKIHPGLSFVDVSMNALEKDPIDGLNLYDAFSFTAHLLDNQQASLITQVYNQFRASELKLELMKVLAPETQVVLVINAGIPEKEIIKPVPLFELDRVAQINHLTSLYIPPQKNAYTGLNGTLAIMEKLRGENGCPWDRAQDHKSLKSYLIEESYEVVEAIDQEDDQNLCEELGDLFFQIVFHAALAEEAGTFTIDDVLTGINEKMVRRHPHVFAKEVKIDAGQVDINWQAIKRQEKGLGPEENDQFYQISKQMKKIPKFLPALIEAQKVQIKAQKVGFDWENPRQASFKLKEEIEEVIEAIDKGDWQNSQEELGDLLFSVVNVARLYGFSSETLLRRATQKFINRFEKMEELAKEDQKTIGQGNFEELEGLWQRSKELIYQEKS